MKDLAVITALTHLGSLENISLSLRKKIKLLFTSLESVCFGKNCALRLKYWCARPSAQSYPMNNIFITDL